MERRAERDLEILTAIEEGGPLTQRGLARRLGVALGLTNLHLRRLARTGAIRIVEARHQASAGNRRRYLLTPRGVAEKTRLSYQHLVDALDVYRRTRQVLRASLSSLPQRGARRIGLCGAGEAAEIAYLTLRELGVEPLAVFTPAGGGQFLGLPVRALAEFGGADLDAVVIATLEPPGPVAAELVRRGVAPDRIVTLSSLAPAGRETP